MNAEMMAQRWANTRANATDLLNHRAQELAQNHNLPKVKSKL